MGLPAIATCGTGQRYRITLGPIGKPFTALRRRIYQFRERVEAAVVAANGEIGVFAAKKIRTACIALRQAGKVEKRIHDHEKDLTHEQWLAYSDRLVRYEEAVDKALASLGLDRSGELSGDPKEPADGAAHNEILTFEERREFWTSLRQALLPVPEAYEAVNKLLADRVKENERRRNAELGQRETVG
jgi:hypothetical protein